MSLGGPEGSEPELDEWRALLLEPWELVPVCRELEAEPEELEPVVE